ncbi:MAG: glycosyltransferase [Candidatus Omnitrophica bacterium]|nr:glycosyltransferase [Candidatus Omnitrophota bacterium]
MTKELMTVSIIVAVKAYCKNLGQCVKKCLELDFKTEDYEIIILPDSNLSQEDILSNSKVKIIPTGDITPPKKRDIGAKEAEGEILAFLDDDTYPDKNWLKEAIAIFKESDKIGCVCGPAVTPDDDSILQKGSGLVYSSFLISGNHGFRYIPKERREVFDFPSCNFLIRKNLFNKVGGFDKPFWPGEDTFLCLKVLETDKRMVYSPKVLVFHHRRKLFKGHLNQIKSYGLHRGYFAKRYPKTSLCVEYFIPSIFVLALLVGGILSLFSSSVEGFYSFSLIMYLIFILTSSLLLVSAAKESRANRVKLLFLTVFGIFLTHFTYGIYFIKGLFAKRMPEE